MYHEGDNGFIFIGRDFMRPRGFCIQIGYGRIDNPRVGEISFRHVWEWVPRLPVSIRIEWGFGPWRRIRHYHL